MRRKIEIILLLAGALSLIAGLCQARDMEINIDYGNIRQARTVTVSVEEGDTALTALMKAAEVATHPLGEYVFVVAVDHVEGKRGDMAWYYTLDGKPAKNLAFRQPLGAATKSMAWNYTRDVCSAKVDGSGAK